MNRVLAWGSTLLLAVLSLTLPARADDARLSVSPKKSPPGTNVTVAGSGFEVDEDEEEEEEEEEEDGHDSTVVIYFDGEREVGQTDLDDSSFSIEVTIPADAARGGHKLSAVTAGESAFATVVVMANPTTTTTTTTTTTSPPSTSTTTPAPSTTTAPDTTTTPPPDTTTTTTAPSPATTPASSTTSPSTTVPATTSPSTMSTTTTERPDTTRPADTTAGGVGPTTSPSSPAPNSDSSPRIAANTVGVRDLTVTPNPASPGSAIQLSFSIAESISGLNDLRVLLDGDALGARLVVTGSKVTATRTVPALPPGTYELELVADGSTLASTDFTITPLTTSQAQAGWTDRWPLIALLVTIGAGLVWALVRSIRHPDRPLGRLSLPWSGPHRGWPRAWHPHTGRDDA